jgi:hypothetical protein
VIAFVRALARRTSTHAPGQFRAVPNVNYDQRSQLPYSLSRHSEEVVDDERQSRLPASSTVDVEVCIRYRTGKRQIITRTASLLCPQENENATAEQLRYTLMLSAPAEISCHGCQWPGAEYFRFGLSR